MSAEGEDADSDRDMWEEGEELEPNPGEQELPYDSGENGIGFDDNGISFDENGSVFDENEISFDENGTGSDENGSVFDENGIGSDENRSVFDENGISFDENGSVFDENGIGYDENGTGSDENGSVYDDNGNGFDENGIGFLGFDGPIEGGAELEPDEGTEQFDINLPATHSYFSELVAVQGCSVLEAGWRGRVPCLGHKSVLFPGETVPLMLQPEGRAQFIKLLKDRLFGLVFADESGMFVSGYGVLCEVFEASETDVTDARLPDSIFLKARTRQRFRFVDAPKKQNIQDYRIDIRTNLKLVNIQILPEAVTGDPLYNSRFSSLDKYRSTKDKKLFKRLRRTDAIATRWPLFVYETRDFDRAKEIIHEYFRLLNYDKLPMDAVSLSFWVASNLPVPYRNQLAIFMVHSALERLWMEADLIQRINVLCCSGCGDEMTQITKRADVFPMSSEGLKSNYCNMYGYIHDIMTVRSVTNVKLVGLPSSECSWFPGYMWTIAMCETCDTHVGWKFTAERRTLRPSFFYGINRNNVSSVLSSPPNQFSLH